MESYKLLSMLAFLIFMLCTWRTDGHGRLIEPPSRSSMWRYGFSTSPNYNDHELYCGGFSRQWITNGGKCGICGDPWDSKQPRENEAGGKYGRGIITRRYRKNQVIKVQIDLTANHMGHFEFHVCPNNNPRKVASQACLDKHPLRLATGRGGSYYPGPGTKIFEMLYRLPQDLTCKQCVLQWKYFAANSWGTCTNGTEKIGCGPQEQFRACSDIQITEDNGSADSTPNNEHDIEFIDHNTIDAADWDAAAQDEDTANDKEDVEKIVASYNVAIIVLSTLLIVGIIFGCIFLYYYKAKGVMVKFLDDHDLEMPSMPSLPMPNMPQMPKWNFKPSIPKFTGFRPKVSGLCKFDKISTISWPLSNISLGEKKLPSFKSKLDIGKPKSVLGSIPRSQITISNPVPIITQAPNPPPRMKRYNIKSRSSSPPSGSETSTSSTPQPPQPRLATIQPRNHPRPPPAPPSVKSLEISSPTDVSINGVSLRKLSPMAMTASTGPRPSSSGIICAARPVIAMSDIPDSSIETTYSNPPPAPFSSTGFQEVSLHCPPPLPSVPPPLPSCPPPDSFQEELENLQNNCTDA